MVIFRRGKYSTLISFLISVLLLLSLLQLTLLQTASALTNYTIYLNNLDSDDYYAKIIVKGGGFLEPVVIGSNIMNKTIHLMVDGPPLSARLILIKKYPSLGAEFMLENNNFLNVTLHNITTLYGTITIPVKNESGYGNLFLTVLCGDSTYKLVKRVESDSEKESLEKEKGSTILDRGSTIIEYKKMNLNNSYYLYIYKYRIEGIPVGECEIISGYKNLEFKKEVSFVNSVPYRLDISLHRKELSRPIAVYSLGIVIMLSYLIIVIKFKHRIKNDMK